MFNIKYTRSVENYILHEDESQCPRKEKIISFNVFALIISLSLSLAFLISYYLRSR